MRAGFKAISTRCSWPLDADDSLYGAKDHLVSCGRPLLLVLDNCDDAKTNCGRFLPTGRQVSVLMTTRLSDGRKYASLDPRSKKDKLFVRMEGLDDEAAVDLLLEGSATEDSDAEGSRSQAGVLVGVLDYHPLAVIVAGFLIRDAIYSLPELLHALEGRFAQRESPRYRGGAGSVQEDVLGFLHPRDVSEDIFMRAWQEEENVARRMEDEDADDAEIDHLSLWHVTQCRRSSSRRSQDKRLHAFRKARAHLERLSLINLDRVSKATSRHALVYGWARERGSQPGEISAFQPMMYQTAAGQDHLANNHHETIEQFLLRECASGQRVDLLTEAVQLQYGHRMTPDDLFKAYRIAFWKTRSWEESDTSLMEQIVREEIRGFWDRVARGVSLSPPVSF
ncbi:hypothetical protein LTR73_008993 [Friedmanniomyces endolithicus]|nr:hypothetical protein LTR73_008993 [Friedmanniomyces endolithicus]